METAQICVGLTKGVWIFFFSVCLKLVAVSVELFHLIC